MYLAVGKRFLSVGKRVPSSWTAWRRWGGEGGSGGMGRREAPMWCRRDDLVEFQGGGRGAGGVVFCCVEFCIAEDLKGLLLLFFKWCWNQGWWKVRVADLLKNEHGLNACNVIFPRMSTSKYGWHEVVLCPPGKGAKPCFRADRWPAVSRVPVALVQRKV